MKTEKELLETQIECLNKNLFNLEFLKEKHINAAKQEVARIEEHYESEFIRVNKEKQELEDKLNNLTQK